MKKSSVIFLSVLILAVFLMGFGGPEHRDIEEYAIVSGIAFDKTSSGYTVCAEVVNAYKSSDKSFSAKVVEFSGESLEKAFLGLNGVLSKKMTLAYCTVMLVGENLAKKDGLEYVAELFSSQNDARASVTVALTEGSAKGILTRKSVIYPIMAYEITELLHKTKESAKLYEIYPMPDDEITLQRLVTYTMDKENYVMIGSPALIRSGKVILS